MTAERGAGGRVISDVLVVVPAADEQDRIGPCLDALARAADEVSNRVRVSIVVVLDRCTDATADVVAARPGIDAVTSTARSVGIARALGVGHGLAAITAPMHEVWIASTDADSIVPAHWLDHMLEAAAAGRDLVVGTIVPGPGLSTALRQRWSGEHVADDGHSHVHGANIGIRADAYLGIAGWSPLASGEDVDLVARAEFAGLDVYRSGGCPVTTSVRATGRAPHGFSSYLRDLAAASSPSPRTGATPGVS